MIVSKNAQGRQKQFKLSNYSALKVSIAKQKTKKIYDSFDLSCKELRQVLQAKDGLKLESLNDERILEILQDNRIKKLGNLQRMKVYENK